MIRWDLVASVGLTLAISSPALGQQSYAESMADCSAVYLVLSRNVEREQNHERLSFAARAWAAAAQDNGFSQEEVIARVRTRVGEWDGDPFVFTDDLKDWTAYCRSFARDRGVEYDSEG